MRAQQVRRIEPPAALPFRGVSLPDSLLRKFNEDSLIAKTIFTPDTVIRKRKSTTVALLASLALPGAGQLYNGSYWKAPIVWGFGYYFVSIYRQQDKLYQRYRKEYTASVDTLHPEGNPTTQGLRDFYRGQRDTFGWYIAITYILNALDAYVDASLFDFEVSPNLSPANELRLSLHVPF